MVAAPCSAAVAAPSDTTATSAEAVPAREITAAIWVTLVPAMASCPAIVAILLLTPPISPCKWSMVVLIRLTASL